MKRNSTIANSGPTNIPAFSSVVLSVAAMKRRNLYYNDHTGLQCFYFDGLH